MIKNYIKIGIRSLLNNRVFTVVNLIGLSLGMSAALLIFLWVSNELSFDTYHNDNENLYRVISNVDVGDEVWLWSNVPLISVDYMKEDVDELEEIVITRFPYGGAVVKFPSQEILNEDGFVYVSNNWFDLLKYETVDGSIDDFKSTLNSIAITKSYADQHFKDGQALGKTIEVDSAIYEVNLILKENRPNTSFQFNVIASIEPYIKNNAVRSGDYSWGNFNYDIYVRTNPNSNIAEVERKMTKIFDDNRKNNNTNITLQALTDIRFGKEIDNDHFVHRSKSSVYIFGVIGLLILITAGLNYISLSTAMLTKRVKEIGIKKIVGASFKHIFNQLMAEATLLIFFATLCSVAVANLFLPSLKEFTGTNLILDPGNMQFLGILAGMFLIGVLVAGIYPAILFGAFKPQHLLKTSRIPKKNISMRQVLVVIQFVIAITMLISTIVIYQQLRYIKKLDVGYDRAYVLEVIPSLFNGDWGKNLQQFDLFTKEAKKISEFEGAAKVGGT
ncbi:MAG: ABC transporter permease, partial [Bacteroidota bacterium]